MPEELKVPEMGESITEGTITEWRIAEGDSFSDGDPLVEIETDKITMDVPAPSAGRLLEILKKSGDTVRIGEVIGKIEAQKTDPKANPKTGSGSTEPQKEGSDEPDEPDNPASTEQATPPAVRHLIEQHNLNPDEIQGTGKHGMILKEDVLRHLDSRKDSSSEEQTEKKKRTDQSSGENTTGKKPPPEQSQVSGGEEVVPMSRLRKRIAERLVESQKTAAILTTFNEVDMSAVLELRKRYKEQYQETYQVSLGFMSFFTKAAIEALKMFPAINAEIRDDNIVYKNYYNIGIAVGGPRGLVVPVVKNADRLSFAGIEQEIANLARKAKDSTLTLPDLEGGTFSISNGGIYGSLLSTPILNPPQSGILGMHKIEKRPVVIDDAIVIRPMMNLALSYDHRIVDGKEAVQFLVRIKECIEDPQRILLEI